VGFAAGVLGSAGAQAQPEPEGEEFSTFRITSVEGAVTLKQLTDSTEVRSGPAASTLATSRQSDSSASLVASISARGFVYHPNLVSLEAGFGLILQRSRFNLASPNTSIETRADERLYDLSAQVNVLSGKPYFGSLFYEHLNPSVSLGPALVIVQQTTREGLQFTLLDSVTPVPLAFEAERLRSSGRGSGRVVEDQTDRYSLTADSTHGQVGSTRLRVDDVRLESQSGSQDLPITRNTSRNLTAGLDTRLHFGASNLYDLSNAITYNALHFGAGLNPTPDRHEWRERMDLRVRYSERWRSFAALDLLKLDQGEQRGRNRTGSAGATWTPTPDHISTLESRSEAFDSSDYSSKSRSALASTSQQWSLAGGRAQAAYALRYDERSQRVTSPTTALIGERHTLPGTTAVSLDRSRVVAGSVQLANEARTQIYVEGRDYLLSVLGVQIRMQRIVGGDIIDGQTVLVDYAVETGGNFDSTQLDQSLSLFWAWDNRLSFSARWLNSEPRVTAGVPLLTLNTVRSRTLRAQTEWPLTDLLSVGANLEHEDRRETIQPYQRTSGEAFAQWEEALFGPGGIRLGVRRQRVAYADSPQDVDLAAWDVRYHLFTLEGVDVQADWTSERDAGTLVKRRRDFGSLRARWRFRQLLMTLSLTRAHEVQDLFETTRTVGQWMLRREF
jgi:hypothetical protein